MVYDLKEYQKKYREKNKDKAKEYFRNYYKLNKDKKLKQRKEYYDKNRKNILLKFRNMDRKEYGNKYYHQVNKKREYFLIKKRLRTRLRNAFINILKERKQRSNKYGINYEKIIQKLKPFPKDISNYHIDHIKPLCSFDLTDPKQVKIAFAPENHQWLLAEENLIKGGRR